MNKKASFIAGVIFISVAVLLFFAIRSFKCPSANVAFPTEAAASSISETSYTTDSGSTETQLRTEASAGAADADPGFSDVIQSSRFTVSKVIDEKTGEEISPRVALGTSYNDCYLSFDDDSRFELYLANLREGVYEINDNIISVVYSDGKGAEFTILSDENAVSVPYGEYNVILTP